MLSHVTPVPPLPPSPLRGRGNGVRGNTVSTFSAALNHFRYDSRPDRFVRVRQAFVAAIKRSVPRAGMATCVPGWCPVENQWLRRATQANVPRKCRHAATGSPGPSRQRRPRSPSIKPQIKLIFEPRRHGEKHNLDRTAETPREPKSDLNRQDANKNQYNLAADERKYTQTTSTIEPRRYGEKQNLNLTAKWERLFTLRMGQEGLGDSTAHLG